eukprot:GFKZ01003132.1.p1 GENE.GFKZ01003132.1~~GFKZ01003132.1.p1  ORF type:complete len:352 (-),score=30.15 GFKZ01003132.1:610-1665(-)
MSIIEQSTLSDESSSNMFGGSLLNVVLILTAAGVQVKGPMLWSESRTLRKLQTQSKSKLRGILSGVENDVDGAFVELYSSLSKGRHRSTGRTFRSFYFLFTTALDVVASLSSEDISTSEAWIALRGVIYSGSFTVLGARKLTFVETGGVAGLAILYGSYIFLTGTGLLAVSPKVQSALSIARLTILGGWTIGVIFQFVIDLRGRGDDLPQIVWSMQKGISQLSSKQALRYERMKKRVNDKEFAFRGTVRGSYWKLRKADYLEMVALTLLLSLNGISWGRAPASQVAAIALIESFEVVSILLLLMNDTQVEPALFMRLLNTSYDICEHAESQTCVTERVEMEEWVISTSAGQ